MNYCKDCLHFSPRFDRCKAPVDYKDPVYGVAFTEFQAAKEMRYSEVFCGAEGKWFETEESNEELLTFGGYVTDYVCPQCGSTERSRKHALMRGGVDCWCAQCGTKYHVCAF